MSDDLFGLISAANGITDETLARFGALSPQQLNWKPDPGQWSVGQCFDHLVTTNGTYFPVLDKVLRGEKKATIWERVPWLPSLWGKFVMNAVDPASKRKVRAPKIFHPSQAKVDDDVIRRFVNQQDQMMRYMKATQDLELEKIIISSPVTNLVTYSLMDAYRIIVSHEKRHLLQAQRVTEAVGYPN